MENRILTHHLTCIVFRSISHENRNSNFISHLTNIFIRCMFLTGNDTRRIFALIPYTKDIAYV